jgi:hypothetical protein
MEPAPPAFDTTNVVVSANGALSVLGTTICVGCGVNQHEGICCEVCDEPPSEIMMQPHCDAIRRDMIDHFIKYGFWDRDMIRRLHRARTERAERSSRSRSRSPTHGRNRSRSPRRRPTDAELAADAPKRTIQMSRGWGWGDAGKPKDITLDEFLDELAADAPKRTRCDRDSKGLGQRVSPVPLVPYP